jgi:hypothetical protein
MLQIYTTSKLTRAKSLARFYKLYFFENTILVLYISLSLLIRYLFEFTNTVIDIGARNSELVLIHLNSAIWLVF